MNMNILTSVDGSRVENSKDYGGPIKRSETTVEVVT